MDMVHDGGWQRGFRSVSRSLSWAAARKVASARGEASTADDEGSLAQKRQFCCGPQGGLIAVPEVACWTGDFARTDNFAFATVAIQRCMTSSRSPPCQPYLRCHALIFCLRHEDPLSVSRP